MLGSPAGGIIATIASPGSHTLATIKGRCPNSATASRSAACASAEPS
jgi:hypothetical protein